MNPPVVLPIQPTSLLVHSVAPIRVDGLVVHVPSGFVYPFRHRSAPPPEYRYIPRTHGCLVGAWLADTDELLAVSAEALRILVVPAPVSRYVLGISGRLPAVISVAIRDLPWNDKQFSTHTSGWSISIVSEGGVIGDCASLPFIPDSLDALEGAQWQSEELLNLYRTFWPPLTR